MDIYSIIFTILSILIASVVAVMWFFAYVAKQYHKRMSQRRATQIKKRVDYGKKAPPPKTDKDDFLSRDKVAEKKKQQEIESRVTRYSPTKEQEVQTSESIEIVGIAEPKGFWSKFVMNQKLGYIMARASFQNKSGSGFWVNLIKAQSASKGKEQGKGR